MPSATITSKGQITLPKSVRERLGLRVGDRVSFREREDGAVVIEPETVDLRELRGALRPRVQGVTVEQMNEVIRRRASAR